MPMCFILSTRSGNVSDCWKCAGNMMQGSGKCAVCLNNLAGRDETADPEYMNSCLAQKGLQQNE